MKQNIKNIVKHKEHFLNFLDSQKERLKSEPYKEYTDEDGHKYDTDELLKVLDCVKDGINAIEENTRSG